MATKQSSVFKTTDRNLIRLRMMCDAGSTKALHTMLRWINPKWMSSMSFKDYLKTVKGISMKALNNALKPHQRVALRKDPKGETYDITLLYFLILWGNEGLAPMDNEDAWKKKSGSLEFLITAVKNVRNNLMHNYEPIDTNEFHQRTETLRRLLNDLINCAGSKYPHITQSEVDKTLQDLDTLINQIRTDPLDPMTLAEYQKQLIFPELLDLVKKEGTNALQIRHTKYSCLTPVSRLAKAKFPVGDIFTDMVLKGGADQKDNLELHYLLEGDNQIISDDIILIEGEAGVGKTTLIKKILNEWANCLLLGEIKHLDTFDLVFHAECREHISSFKGVLDSSMAEVSKSFQGNDLTLVVLSLRCLMIIDGFDELNRISAELFEEILQIKRRSNLTVIITSRPEAITKYYQVVNPHQIGTRHIQLLGIPLERREDFVKKYYAGMEKAGLSNQNIEGLLHYLKRTEHRLTELWRLPYNLTILTILWAIRPDIINSITTAPELHWEMHELYLCKLKERLVSNEATKHLPASAVEKKVQQFIYCLCHVSLNALANDDVTLPKGLYQQLENTCNEIEVPVEEMVGAFLKQINSDSGTRYAYPHKGLQDFLAALYILLRLTVPPENSDIEKIIRAIGDTLTHHNVSVLASQNIRRFSKGELTRKNPSSSGLKVQAFNAENVEQDIENVLMTNKVPEDLSADISKLINDRINKHFLGIQSSSVSGNLTKEGCIATIIQEEISQFGTCFDSTKFQNMFTVLIGLFYKDRTGAIVNETKLEVLELLQGTGVKNADAWLNILNSVKCEQFVAAFVSKEVPILEGDISITDSKIFGYISLIKALSPPLPNAHSVRLSIDIKGDISGVDEFLNLATIHQFSVRSIFIYDNNFKEYTEVFKSLQTPLKESDKVNINMDVKEKLINIRELMFQIKRNNFNFVKWKTLERGYITIDKNFEEYLATLKSMPTLLENACVNLFFLKVKGTMPSVINELLLEISRIKYKVEEVEFTYDFRNPSTTSRLEGSLNEVFERCAVQNYTGLVSKDMILPNNLRQLNVSIADESSYITLWKYLDACSRDNRRLNNLSLCMSHSLAAASHLMKLLCFDKRIFGTCYIYITSVKLSTDVDNAVMLLKTLEPANGFQCIFFPRASLSYKMIAELIEKLVCLKELRWVALPSSNKPSSPEEESHIRQLAKQMLGTQMSITWGSALFISIDNW